MHPNALTFESGQRFGKLAVVRALEERRLHFNINDLPGKRFGRLTVVSYSKSKPSRGAYWNCMCECGKTHIARGSHLVLGNVKSCGCLNAELAGLRAKGNIKHGLSGTLTGNSWLGMVQRCYNKNNHAYSVYGAVGIVACEFLRASPLNIILCIGERPSSEMTLERINNSLGYYCGECPECTASGFIRNVKWATKSEQSLNRAVTRAITIGGQVKSWAAWKKLLLSHPERFSYVQKPEN